VVRREFAEKETASHVLAVFFCDARAGIITPTRKIRIGVSVNRVKGCSEKKEI